MAGPNMNAKMQQQELQKKSEKRDINTTIIFWSFLLLFVDALCFTFPVWTGIAWFFGQFGAPEVWKTFFWMLGGVIGFGSLGAGLYCTKQVQ